MRYRGTCKEKTEIEVCCHKPRKARSHQELEGQGRISFYRLWRVHSPINTLISDFWPPKLLKNKCLLFEVINLVKICHDSPRNKTLTFFFLFVLS